MTTETTASTETAIPRLKTRYRKEIIRLIAEISIIEL